MGTSSLHPRPQSPYLSFRMLTIRVSPARRCLKDFFPGNLTHLSPDPNDPAGSSAAMITLFATLVLSPESSCSQELLRRLPIWLSELFVLLPLVSSICLGERDAFLRLCVLEGAPLLLMLRGVISSVVTTGRFPDDPLPIMILIFFLWLSQFSNLNQWFLVHDLLPFPVCRLREMPQLFTHNGSFSWPGKKKKN